MIHIQLACRKAGSVAWAFIPLELLVTDRQTGAIAHRTPTTATTRGGREAKRGSELLAPAADCAAPGSKKNKANPVRR